MNAFFRKYKILLFCFLIVSICSYLLIHNSCRPNVQKILSELPSEDKKALEDFFEVLLFTERMAYVVFGTKPMMLCFFSRFHPHPHNDLHHKMLHAGWSIWKKYEEKFPHPNFVFRSFEDPEHDEAANIVLINKKNLLKEFQQYPEERDLLTQNTTLHKWLQNFETSSKSFKECFQHNHALGGIAFGFSKHNSLMFQKEWEIFQALIAQYPNKDRESINEEYEKLDHKIILTCLEDEDPEPIQEVMVGL